MRRDPPEHVALGRRLAHQADVALLEVADAAVDQLRAAAARAGPEVVALDQRHAEAAEGGVACHARPGDAAADNQQLELTCGQGGEIRLARLG